MTQSTPPCELRILKDKKGVWTYRIETVEKNAGGWGKHICDLNARLIVNGTINPYTFAAGPELLSALKGMLEVFADDTGDCEDMHTVIRAREVIAKAIGAP